MDEDQNQRNPWWKDGDGEDRGVEKGTQEAGFLFGRDRDERFGRQPGDIESARERQGRRGFVFSQRELPWRHTWPSNASRSYGGAGEGEGQSAQFHLNYL